MSKIIKISINFIISLIIFFIVSLLGIYLLLAISGINLKNINLQNIHIGQLYIKIDKKLIIKANNIKILTKKSNTKTNYKKINKIIKNNFLYLNYFQKISLKNIQINNIKINSLNFFNNKLEFDTDLLYLKASFIPQNKKIDFIIHKITYKPINITLNNIEGYEKANLFKLILFAKYKYQNSNLSLNLNIGFHIKYNLSIKNLNPELINKFTPILKNNNINLNSQNLIINGNKNKLILNATNLSIKLNNYKLIIDIPTLTGEYYKNNELKLNPHKLYLTQLDINNSDKLFINNSFLSFKNNKLFVKLHTNEILNLDIINLLKKFNIPIPVYQKTGQDNVFVNLTYNFINKKIDTYIKARVLNSKLMITNNDYLIIKKGNLELNNSIITLKNSNLNYKKSIVTLDYYIKNGMINLDKNFIKTDGKIESLKLENIGEINDFNESTYINLNKISINLKNLQTNILINNDTNITINKLSILYPYISYLKEYKILDGNIKINIANKININTDITKTNQQILEQNLKPLKELNLTTVINDNNISIKNKYFKINILNKNPMKIESKIKNIDLNITKFINEALKEKNSTKESNLSNQLKPKKEYILDLKGINNNIIYETHQLYSNKLSAHYDNNFTYIESLDNDRNITLIEKNNVIKIYGFNLKEKDLKQLVNITFIKDAKINFFALETNQSSAIHGFIKINKGYIKELKAFNNIIAFINLIPSIVTFDGPGFSSKGFKIRKGNIDYIYDKGILYIKKAELRGDNLKFKAQGYIDLVKKTIKMNVDATIIVKLVKDIPIVNYIILGKNGGINIRLLVSGKLNNPKVSKNLTKEVIKAPFGIIKRTILTPFRIFMKE
jgi:hypothetical protein